jgi:threonine/homoserine/homoserine lactone efflux protein
MISHEALITFIGAAFLLGLAPGPDNLFVLTQSVVRGRMAGMMVTLGLCTGLIVHSCAVAFGVAVIFQTSALAFTVLKFIGAGYLVYLAWQILRAPADKVGSNAPGAISWRRLYVRGIIMNITNPKVSIFFLAFLPQFADPARGSIPVQMLMLGGIFIGVTIVVFGSIALLAGWCAQWLNRSERNQLRLNKLAGLVFLTLALKLATTTR